MHFRASSESEWHTIGHRLAPKQIWEGLLEHSGTSSLVVQGKRPGSPATHLRVTVQPSVRIQPGLFVGTEERFDGGGSDSPAPLVDTLQSQWEEGERYALYVAKEVLQRAAGAK
jgi:hypothetical protein